MIPPKFGCTTASVEFFGMLICYRDISLVGDCQLSLSRFTRLVSQVSPDRTRREYIHVGSYRPSMASTVLSEDTWPTRLLLFALPEGCAERAQ